MNHFVWGRVALATALGWGLVASSLAQTPTSAPTETVVLPKSVPDLVEPVIRLLVNRDDFLLPAEDLAWLKTTFAPDQLTVFEHGGHLGNLSHLAVQKAILEALEGLRDRLKSHPPTRTRIQ